MRASRSNGAAEENGTPEARTLLKRGTQARIREDGAAGEKIEVFVSHAGSDSWVAGQIARRIAQSGVNVFVSEMQVEKGDPDFEESLRKALEQCSELIVLVTPEALSRPYVWLEIGAVWLRRKRINTILYKVSVEDLRRTPEIPALILKGNLIDLNKDGEWFIKEVRARLRHRRTRS